MNISKSKMFKISRNIFLVSVIVIALVHTQLERANVKPLFKFGNSSIKEEISKITVKLDQVEVYNATSRQKGSNSGSSVIRGNSTLKEEISRITVRMDQVEIHNATNRQKSSNSGSIVIYNRISKCGSMTMISLINRLAKRNRFKVNRHINNIIKNYHPGMEDTIFIEHKFFQPVPLHLRDKITYINVWRDPMKRYISGYHYYRDHLFKKYVSAEKKGEIMIVTDGMLQGISKKWLEKNIHTCGNEGLRDGATNLVCQKNMKYIVKDASVVQRVKDSARQWLKKPFADCVYNVHDKECNDFTETRPKQMDFKQLLLLWHAGPENLLYKDTSKMYPPFMYKPTAGYYLCGNRGYCFSAKSKKARNESIRNIDLSYSVVGIVEDMVKTISVLENKLPRFFDGALEEFKNMEKEDAEKRKGMNSGKDASQINVGSYDTPNQAIMNILKNGFTEEYRVYDYVVKRLNKQYASISLSN